MTGGHPPTFTDSEIEWEKTYEYRVDVATLISEAGKADVQVEGEDSPIATVMAHEFFRPPFPLACRQFPPVLDRNFSSISSGPRLPMLIWRDTTYIAMKPERPPAKSTRNW